MLQKHELVWATKKQLIHDLQWTAYELAALRECVRLIVGDELAERIEERLTSKMLVAEVTRHMDD